MLRRSRLLVPLTLSGALAAACSSKALPARVSAAHSSASQAQDPSRSGSARVPTTPPTSTVPVVPPPVTTSSTGPIDLQSCARDAAARLSLPLAVAQLFDVGVTLPVPATAEDLVQSGVGAIFLSGRSHAGVATGVAVARLQAAARRAGVVAPYVSADEEGGVVQSVDGPGIPTWPSALAQSTWTLPDLRARAAQWATSLHQAGITLDLAPVADVVAAAEQADNPAIGALQRNYGSTPEGVAERVDVVVAALQQAHVAGTVKHFPGLGRTTTNTDRAAYTSDPETTPADANLAPFASAIDAGVRAVMVSSAHYPRLDPAQPAVFSPEIITSLLRGRLHFGGLVLSDDLAQARAVASVPVAARAVDFLRAGGDMVVIVTPDDLPSMESGLLAAARSSSSFQDRVRDAAEHVLLSKAQGGLLACPS